LGGVGTCCKDSLEFFQHVAEHHGIDGLFVLFPNAHCKFILSAHNTKAGHVKMEHGTWKHGNMEKWKNGKKCKRPNKDGRATKPKHDRKKRPPKYKKKDPDPKRSFKPTIATKKTKKIDLKKKTTRTKKRPPKMARKDSKTRRQ
jgi:hypothetical protein